MYRNGQQSQEASDIDSVYIRENRRPKVGLSKFKDLQLEREPSFLKRGTLLTAKIMSSMDGSNLENGRGDEIVKIDFQKDLEAHKPIFAESYLKMKKKLNFFYGSGQAQKRSRHHHPARKLQSSTVMENYGLDSNPSLVKKPEGKGCSKHWNKLRKQYNAGSQPKL